MLDTKPLRDKAIAALFEDREHKHIVLTHGREFGWKFAGDLLDGFFDVARGGRVTVATTIPDALSMLNVPVQPTVLVLCPSMVFPVGWRFIVQWPTKVHATFPMHDEEIAQFIGRFNGPPYGASDEYVALASRGAITRFSDITN